VFKIISLSGLDRGKSLVEMAGSRFKVQGSKFKVQSSRYVEAWIDSKYVASGRETDKMAEPLKTMPEACDVSPDAINTTQADRRSVVEAVRGSYKHLGEMRWAMKDSSNSEMSHISDMQDHPSPSVTTLRFACMVLIALRARRLSEALGLWPRTVNVVCKRVTIARTSTTYKKKNQKNAFSM